MVEYTIWIGVYNRQKIVYLNAQAKGKKTILSLCFVQSIEGDWF